LYFDCIIDLNNSNYQQAYTICIDKDYMFLTFDLFKEILLIKK